MDRSSRVNSEIVLVNFSEKKSSIFKICTTLVFHKYKNEQFIYLERLVLLLFL